MTFRPFISEHEEHRFLESEKNAFKPDHTKIKDILDPCLASITMLKACKSRNPNPPLVFGFTGFSISNQLFFCVFIVASNNFAKSLVLYVIT